PIDSQPPKNGATNQHSTRAQGEGLQNVGATANTAIQIDLATTGHGLNDLWQRLDTRHSAIELAAPMIRDNDTRDAVFKRQQCVFCSQNALDQDRQPALDM